MNTVVISRALTSAFGAIALAAGGCGPTSSPPPGQPAAVQSEYSNEGRLTKLASDRNGDGHVDTWGFMDGARVVRVEVDENGDGTVNRWEFHTESATGSEPAGRSRVTDRPDHTIERIERSTQHDGTANRREFFEAGLLTRVEEDTNGDGRIDKWETYEAGTLRLTALDTAHRGKADRRIVYDADGSFVTIETDPSGSGTFAPLTP